MEATDSRPSPNVVWIFGDQHRGQALGCAGDANLHTPNIDRLAAEGTMFPAAVAGTPLCCPFRGSLLTGLYPHHCVPGHEMPLPEGQPTIAQPFQEAGYQTAYFGKWHLSGFKEKQGRAVHHIVPPHLRGGFETWVGYENNNSPWDCWIHGGEGDEAYHSKLAGYETDALADLFIAHLQQRAREHSEGGGRPFFAALSVQPPHDPYLAPEEWMGRHTPGQIALRPNVPDISRIRDQARRNLAGYYAQIENFDWNLGRIRQALAETGLWENTLIVFFSDHGDMHGSHGQFLKTCPWEEALRVPFIVSGGIPHYGTVKKGRCDIPVNHVDVAPTTLGLCGIKAPEWMQGADLSGFCLKDRTPSCEPDSAYLQLVVPTGHGYSVDRPWRGVATRDGWKYIALEGQPWLMFNLNEDPYEQANLAHNRAFAAERKRLHDRLRAWISDTGDTFRLPDLN